MCILHTNNYYYTRLEASLPGQPGRYKKSKASLDLNKAKHDGFSGWQWHQLEHMKTICTSLQTDNHTNTSSLNFYKQDVLLDVQPTVLKH